MNKTFTVTGKKETYEITLKNGKKIKLWFIGDTLKKVLDDYKIPYEIVKR